MSEMITLYVTVPAPTLLQIHTWLLAHKWVEVAKTPERQVFEHPNGWQVTVPQSFACTYLLAGTLQEIAHLHQIESLELYKQITTRLPPWG